ncbi:MAG: sensor histidine kinase [Polaromonas sp.]|nr:sensor histidine kinase [Polaromonas sp.]
MSLRLQINLIITVLTAFFASAVIGLQIENTRRAVHEEVLGANVVALQLLSRMSWVDGFGGLQSARDYLSRVGRVRANEIVLYGADGKLLYRSPPSTYKVGRRAPQWYARLVSPLLEPKMISLPSGRITLQPDASRAELDGWDDLRPLLWMVLAGFVAANGLVYALIGRATKPLRLVVRGLRQMEAGTYGTRLPDLSGREGRQISHAFNAMAQSVQDSALARHQAQEATRALAENRELTQLIQARIEQERGAIARELHDELGQQVTAIKSGSLAIARKAAGHDALIEQSARLVMDCADQIYDGVHRLIAQLRPLALDRFGLHDALQDLLADWRLHHPDAGLTLSVSGSFEGLGDDLSTAAYRIVQEAVNNAVRHARASRIEVKLDALADRLQLEVIDNGVGHVTEFHQPGHFGVMGMRERAQALGGSFDLDQRAPAGVRIRVSFPLTRLQESRPH